MLASKLAINFLGESCYLLRERTAASTLPLFLREGASVPDGVDIERVTFVARTYVDAPVREDEELPAPEPEAAPAVERAPRREALDYPNLGLA